ncbi:MAG TPA: response regulator [Mycobacterium sp.]
MRTLPDEFVDQRRPRRCRTRTIAVGGIRNYSEHRVVPSRPALLRRSCLEPSSGHPGRYAPSRIDPQISSIAPTIAEAIQRVEELRPDVTLVDVDLGGESGFTLARELHRPNSHTPPKIILISAHSERDFARLIAASPALGFVPKADLSPEAIYELFARA